MCKLSLLTSVLLIVNGCSLDRPGVPLDRVDCPTDDLSADCQPPVTQSDPPFVPSNGVGETDLIDVTGGLIIPADTKSTIDTQTGEITIDADTVRGPGSGIVDEIGFSVHPGDIGVLAVTSLTIERDAYVRVSGPRPLIIVSDGDVLIAGVVDISAGCDDPDASICGGPGGGDGSSDSEVASSGCAAGGNGEGNLPGNGRDETGGAGGGLGTVGGNGGDGGDANGGRFIDLAGCPDASLIPLIGGSGGGAGGIGAVGGDGGGGGGALQITSFTELVIAGDDAMNTVGINAAGAGGLGGESSDGGGGGGSGGAILLEAPAIQLRAAVLAANGGGGGGGGRAPLTRRGENGAFGAKQAAGGASGGSQGGFGASREGAATQGAGGGDDTGGGGGGAGIIRLNAFASMLMIDEPSTVITPTASRGELSTAPRN